ncbi:chemotaxis protein CheA [Rhodothermus profundi]|uniref:histidine kinase n=1 Tax=Rhodothermus profundi TaxID=633813 RepID=A0A1M6PY53_9BACT|nr:chemotaxis protein CheA [Rhodothermus profundi]SHK12868.1 two-component system, chemotaxis family, sensor kinase CheA [Rhodothermus profundi]
MSNLVEQFVIEARELLQGISEQILTLEAQPDHAEAMHELFRLVHTLKGNSGLVEAPAMTRVLHVAEDVIGAVREGRQTFSRDLADALLEAFDFVALLVDELEQEGSIQAAHEHEATRHIQALQKLDGKEKTAEESEAFRAASDHSRAAVSIESLPPEAQEIAAQRLQEDRPLYWVVYEPEEDCFFKGDDPFLLVRQTPGVCWGRIVPRAPWPPLDQMDPYRCVLRFELLSEAPLSELEEHFRYVADQIRLQPVAAQLDAADAGVAPTESKPPIVSEEAIGQILEAQRAVLESPIDDGFEGRMQAVKAALEGLLRVLGRESDQSTLEAALDEARRKRNPEPLRRWIDQVFGVAPRADAGSPASQTGSAAPPVSQEPATPSHERPAEARPRTASTLRVSQERIDALMSLVGELVVAKNGLAYLASRVQRDYDLPELSREIKLHFAAIHRIAEELQDAVMQVRMLPFAHVFQRFPRLVRDLARRLGKEVRLEIIGEDTEADKRIIESLADPLIHLIRNSLDHGIEPPEERKARGKPETGLLRIRTRQEGDRIWIEVSDDGRGIDPEVIKRKAYEKGLLDEAALERISAAEALQFLFRPGFSTASSVSDISGRGVGLDVVKRTVEQLGGSVRLESEPGKGTRFILSLPLSMMVTQVLIVEVQGQLYGLPVEAVVETVRVAPEAIQRIHHQEALVLRNQVIPVESLQYRLNGCKPSVEAADTLAVVVLQLETTRVGLLVDDFRETLDVVLKPLPGVLAGLSLYAGSALLGDGTVLMILNPKTLLASCRSNSGSEASSYVTM